MTWRRRRSTDHGDEDVLLLLLVEVGAVEHLPRLLLEQLVQRQRAVESALPAPRPKAAPEPFAAAVARETLRLRCLGLAMSVYAQVLVRVPIPSIETFTTSPALRNSLRASPTPAGVPVRIRSPG